MLAWDALTLGSFALARTRPPRGSLRLVDAGLRCVARDERLREAHGRGPWLVRAAPAADVPPGERYAPFRARLVSNFGDLAGAPDTALLRFAALHGFLGSPVPFLGGGDGADEGTGGPILSLGEALPVWRREAVDLRLLLTLAGWANPPDRRQRAAFEANLAPFVEWAGDGSSVSVAVPHRAGAPDRRAALEGRAGADEVGTVLGQPDTDPARRMARLGSPVEEGMGVVAETYDGPDLAGWRRGDVFAPAREFVRRRVNANLAGRVSPRVPRRGRGLVLVPDSLLAGLYVELAVALAGGGFGGEGKRCAWVGEDGLGCPTRFLPEGNVRYCAEHRDLAKRRGDRERKARRRAARRA